MAETLRQSSTDLPDTVLACREAGKEAGSVSDRDDGLFGGCWTLNTSEWPSDGVASSLSQVLETNPDPKYFLSPEAAAGILRRAKKKGKRIPKELEKALQNAAALA